MMEVLVWLQEKTDTPRPKMVMQKVSEGWEIRVKNGTEFLNRAH